MSYNEILEVEETFTPKELADRLNIEQPENEELLYHLTEAINSVQTLHGDDTLKWLAIKKIVQAMNLVDEEAEIDFGETHITVTQVENE